MMERDNHNAHVAYPLAEDCLAPAWLGACALIDARFVSFRLPPPVRAYLDKVERTGDDWVAEVSLRSGGSVDRLSFTLPLNAALPYRAHHRIAGVAAGFLLFGPCADKMDPSPLVAPLPFEDALCVSTDRHRLDAMLGSHDTPEGLASVRVAGRCAVEEGANVRVWVDEDSNALVLEAWPGAGPMGRVCGPAQRDCGGYIYTVNGLPLGADGDLRLVAGPGMSVASSMGVVTIRTTRPATAPSCEDPQ
jgi:hypothetical protein